MNPVTLHTDRLTLRPVTPGDAEELVAAINFPEVAATTLNIPFPYAIDDARQWIDRSAAHWEKGDVAGFIIVLNDSGRIGGGLALAGINPTHRKAELGFWLTPSLWNRGYVTEACRAVLDWGFRNLEIDRVYAGHFAGNDASRRVQEKLGFKLEGVLRRDVIKWGQPRDHVLMAILRSEWERQA